MDSVWKPNVEMAPSCPRCSSSNTKFCYYNNYSLTQPRYFCKGCRRYWTKGGSLRNVPVGGGCRKNRRGSNNNRSLLRLTSNAGIVHSRSLDDLATKHPYDHDHDRPQSEGDDHYRSSGSSHIDLAVVYANFLNPQPDSNPSRFDEIPSELPCEFINLEEPNLCDNGQFVYHPHPTLGPSIFSDINDDGLPPLPGEDHLEAVSGETLWPEDDNHGFQMINQHPLSAPESHQDPDHLLFGNWSPFQFSG